MADETPQQTTIVAAVCTAIGMGITALTSYLLKKGNASSRSGFRERDQIFKEYRAIVDGLGKNLDSLKIDFAKAQQAHLECRVENESLKTEMKLVRVQLAETQSSLAEAKEQLNHNSTRLDGLEGRRE